MLARQDRRGFVLQRRQVVHEVVERFERAVPGVAHHRVESPLLRFAGEERDAHRLRLAQLHRHLVEHGDAAGDVEAADHDRNPRGQERAGEIDGAEELVRLHADEADERAAAGAADHRNDFVRAHAAVGFVVGVQMNIHVRAEDAALLRVLRQPVHAGQRVRGNGGADPLDRIAVVVVMRRLDHDKVKRLPRCVGRLIVQVAAPDSGVPAREDE